MANLMSIPLDGFSVLRARINGVVFSYPGRGCIRIVVDQFKPTGIECWLCFAGGCGGKSWCPCGRSVKRDPG